MISGVCKKLLTAPVKKSLPAHVKKCLPNNVKKCLLQYVKNCLPRDEKTPYHVMVNSSYRAQFSNDDNFILLGATHKTLSGPTCGLIMTNNMRLASRFDTKINPDYLRNVQLHHIVSLILALMEFEIIGSEYSSLVIRNANILAGSMKGKDFVPIEIFGGYSNTHQVFISMEKDKAMDFFKSCEHYGVTLNLRQRKIYRNCGIRIGTQQISRYGWSDSEMVDIAIILELIRDTPQDESLIYNKIKELSFKKNLKFTLDKELHNKIYSVLHDS